MSVSNSLIKTELRLFVKLKLKLVLMHLINTLILF